MAISYYKNPLPRRLYEVMNLLAKKYKHIELNP
jgi:hypothetical protein